MKKEKGKIVIDLVMTDSTISSTQKIKALMDMALFGATALVNELIRKAMQSGMTYNEARNKVFSVMKEALKCTKEVQVKQ